MKKRSLRNHSQTTTISRICTDAKCTRVGVRADKLSDFWVTRCQFHINTTITLDLNKVGR